MGRTGEQLKPQDLLVLLKLISQDSTAPRPRMVDLAQDLGVSPSEVSQGLERLRKSQLVNNDKSRPIRKNALEFLVHGLRYVFPAVVGYVTRGIPTGHSAPPLSDQIAASPEDLLVWPDDDGEARGHSIFPLYPSAPFAARKDPKLYELLALVDSLRVGRAREREAAVRELSRRVEHS